MKDDRTLAILLIIAILGFLIAAVGFFAGAANAEEYYDHRRQLYEDVFRDQQQTQNYDPNIYDELYRKNYQDRWRDYRIRQQQQQQPPQVIR